MAGINISLVSNVRDFIKGTKDSSAALEDVVESLEDVAREGDTLARKNDQNMREVAKDGEQASEKLERSFRDAFDTAKKESRNSMDDVSRNTRRSMDDSTDHVRAFKDEARQNFSEVASSFDGTTEGILNGVQGLSGGLAMSMGPAGVGIAALGAGAAAVYSMWDETSRKTEQRVSEMYEDMIQSGMDYLSQEMIIQRVKDIVAGNEDAVIQMETVAAVQEATGRTQAEIIAAAAGDLEARANVIDSLTGVLDGLVTEYNKMSPSEKASSNTGSEISALANLKDKFEALNGAQSEAIDKANVFRDVLLETSRNANNDKLTPYFDVAQRKITATTDALNQMPSTKTVTVTADTTAAEAAIKRLTSTQKVRIEAEYATRYGRQVL